MAWLRLGDNIVTHPYMSKILESSELSHQLKNEVFGVFSQLSSVSAAHLTDAWVEMGMIAQIAPGRESIILDVLVDAGLAERVKTEDKKWKIRLVLDDEEFVHARKRDEVLIDRRRSADKRRDDLMIPVRVRDGDECRWCGRTVSWGNRSGARGATIDSLSGHKDSTINTLVVACRGCNSKRHEGGVHLDLREAPGNPYYTDHTIELVNDNKWAQEQGIHIEPRQTRLPLDNTTTQAAASRQQTSDQAADEQPGSSAPKAAAPAAPEAPDTSGAPGQTAPGDDPFEDAPEWVTASLEEIRAGQVQAAVAAEQAAPGKGSDDGKAAPSRQQSEGQAAAPEKAAAPADQAAPDQSAPPSNPQGSFEGSSPECNETVKPGSNLDREGDEAGLVGSGRVGSGRAGQVRAGQGRTARRPRRRGKRGGRKA